MNSICIATYNGEKYLHEQLSSILSQINIDDEVIISDDNSTDNTIQIINNINDPRIKLINGGFHNFTFNFENAIKQAKGEYIFFLELCRFSNFWESAFFYFNRKKLERRKYKNGDRKIDCFSSHPKT
jgi:glycosyltransferase involved in cell wall biosynthesis